MAALIASKVVCDGNSVTFGVGGTAYPTQLQTLLVAQGGVPVTNVAASGKTTQNLIDDFATKTAPLVSTGAELVFFEQYNSFNPFNGNRSVVQEQTLVQTYVSQAKAAGFKVWICAPPPTSDTDINDKITSYAAWLRDNHGFADGFIDLHALAVLKPPGSTANATYYSDSVHLTTTGYGSVASLVAYMLSTRLREARAQYATFARSLFAGTTKLTESYDSAGNLILTRT